MELADRIGNNGRPDWTLSRLGGLAVHDGDLVQQHLRRLLPLLVRRHLRLADTPVRVEVAPRVERAVALVEVQAQHAVRLRGAECARRLARLAKPGPYNKTLTYGTP